MNNEALFGKAIALIKHKEYDEAEDILKRLIAENPDKENLYLTLGNIYLFKNKKQQAMDTYEKAMQIAPENPDIYCNIGLVYKQQGDMDEATSYLQKALSLAKDRADIYYNLGNIYKQLKNYTEAEKIFLEAIKLQPEFVQVYNNLGSLYIEKGEFAQAEEIINKGLAIDENHPRLLYNLGVVKDLQGKSEEAIGFYKHSIVTQPLWVDSLNNLGIAYHKSNKHGKAIKTFNNALDVEPNNPVLKNNIAATYESVGEEKKAKEYYKEAISQNPEYIKASLNLSALYRETGDFDNALKELSRIETINPKDEEIKIQKAHVYFEQGEFDDAEKIIDHSIKSESKGNSAAFALKALLSIKKGKSEEATKYIEKADALEPGNIPLKNAKAELYRQKGDLKKAENEFKDILSLNKGNLKVSIELAKVLKEQEKFEDAISVLDSLKGDYKYYNDTITEYTDIYKKTGQTEKALEYSNQFLGKMGEDDSQIDISSLSKGIELFEEASKSYEILNNERMEERLSGFVKEYVKSEQDKIAPQDAMSFLVGAIEGLNDEQVPILDIGGIEPVIEINEEEEMRILNEDENLDDEDKEIGLYEEAKDKIEKEIIEKYGKDMPQFFPPRPFPMPPINIPMPSMPAPSFPQAPPQMPAAPQPQSQPPSMPPAEAPLARQPAPPQQQADNNQEDMLKKYDGVEEPEGEPVPNLKDETEYVNTDIAGLLDSLEGLTDFLTEGRKDKYESSVMKLKVATLKRKLNGNKGLLDTLAENDEGEEEGEPEEKIALPEKRSNTDRREDRDRRTEDRRSIQDRRDSVKEDNEIVTKGQLENTFSYIKGLADFLPEEVGVDVLKLKISKLLGKIDEKTSK
ncbi:MAG: tetratricopeptide repeat protein [Spirochaetaceae bacterium]|nr:tetratricopeptide repeat protein [Spirochaetaceae bacterium]